MCDDCKKRLITNPLRILDCKNDDDKDIIYGAPKLLDFMSIDSLKRFEKLLRYLDIRNIPYVVDQNFVRGIDYQNDTIFEILNNDENFGAQNNLCGGGRYDNLYKHLSGKEIPAFGFDFGLERLITSIKYQNPDFFSKRDIDLFLVNIGDNIEYCFELIKELREKGIVVEYDFDNNSFKSQLKYSDRFNPKYTAFIGENEKNSDIITLRKNSCGEKFTINRDEIVNLFNTEKRKVKSLW